MSPTDKDKPKSRGLPATTAADARREAFGRLTEELHRDATTGVAAKQAAANLAAARSLLRSVKPKR